MKIDQAKSLITYLVTWGSITVYEMSSFSGGAEWLNVLQQAGIVEEHRSPEGKPIDWSLSKGAQGLLNEDSKNAMKIAFFQVKEYRSYLVGIIAEGLVLSAKQDMQDQVEAWTGSELLLLLKEINQLLDTLETGVRLIDRPMEEISRCFDTLKERKINWDAWNQVLLGQICRPQELFDFVLKRFIPQSCLPSLWKQDNSPVILQPFSLHREAGFDISNPLKPAAWNIRRQHIPGSLAIFDENGVPLSKTNSVDARKIAIQNALVEQPFYKAVVHLAISAYRLSISSSPSIELYIEPGESIGKILLFYAGYKVGYLSKLLPVLVECQGVYHRGVSAKEVPLTLVENMMLNLLEMEMLRQSDDNLVLHPDFQSSLMAARLRSVFRPGKDLQNKMLERIHESMQKEKISEVGI